MDRLHAHTDPTTVAKLAKRNVFTLLFNANASLYIQPLDGVVFSVLKRVFRANVWTYVLEDSMCDESDCSPVYHAAYDAMDKAFQKNVIIAAFRDRGIWPWRRDVVMNNALQWIKAARPSESVEERGQFIASVADAAVKLEVRVLERVSVGTRAVWAHGLSGNFDPAATGPKCWC